MKTILLITLLAAPAIAEVPGGHVYFGVGGFWAIPQAAPAYVSRYRQDLHVSLDLTIEGQRAFGGISAGAGGLNLGQPQIVFVAVRGGYTLLDGPTAPYVAFGLALMGEGTATRQDCADHDSDCLYASGSGLALAPEVGVLFWRDGRVGRLNLAAQLLLPTFTMGGAETDVPAGPMLLLGIRLMG